MQSCTVYKGVRKPIGISNKKISQTVEFVLKSLKISGEVSVHLIADTKMRQLNAHYRGKDKTTDVLSFAMVDDEIPGGMHNDWGDIFISIPQIERQAKRFNVTRKEEFMRMLVHGTLHLLGYDHEKKSDANIMFPLQEKLLKKCL